jgi:hypothetical protein
MNSAEKYFEEQMQDTEFRKAFNEEKSRLDIVFLLDELTEKIKMEKPTNELLKGVRKIKRTLKTA